jgi:hypothetical protein
MEGLGVEDRGAGGRTSWAAGDEGSNGSTKLTLWGSAAGGGEPRWRSICRGAGLLCRGKGVTGARHGRY